MSPFSRIAFTFILAVVATARAAEWPMPATTPAAAGFSAERLDGLHQKLRGAVDQGKYSGYIVLLARDGRIVDWRAHGWQDIAAKTPLQKDSILRIYSMSKIITSAAILMLLEDGRLLLSDPIDKYLPALKDRKVFVGGTADAPQLADAKRAITIRDLLTHTAGYYYDEAWCAEPGPMTLMHRAKLWEATSLDDFVTRLAPVPLHDQPGTRYRYGVSTDLLGAIVEKASGQKLDAFLADRIFRPLDMRDTGFVVPPEKRARLALVHGTENGPLAIVPRMNEQLGEQGLMSGGGGLFSTAADYARFAQMLLNGGQLGGVRLVSRKTVELMTQDHLVGLADPHPNGIPAHGFGFGVRVVTHLGASTTIGSAGTFGWDGAASTTVQIDPKERTVAMLLLQHVPFNEGDIFATFTNGYYAALVE